MHSVHKLNLGLLLFATGAGMSIEVYDFLIYGYLANILGKVLFPPTANPLVATLQALLVFGVGFLMRPVGAAVFGHVGDKYGRKISFIITIALMGVASLGIGLLPTYSQIGILSTIFLVIFRLLQGLSLGGELGAAATYIIEHAPSSKRTLYGSLVQLAWPAGLLGAVLTLYAAVSIIGSDAMAVWGWRVPFFIAAGLVVIALVLRFWLEETPIYKDYAVKGEVATSPVVDVFRKAWKPFAIILIIQSGQAAVWYTGYIATFTTFWLNIAKIPYITTLTMFALIYFVVAFLYPLSGILGDRYGRRSLFTWPLTIAAITIVPLLYLFAMTKNLAVLSLSTIFILTPAVITNAAWAAAYLELLPANIRISGFNIAYQLATAVFGGFLPYIITALLQITNNVAISASYIAALAAMSAIVSWKWLPETKNVDLRKTV